MIYLRLVASHLKPAHDATHNLWYDMIWLSNVKYNIDSSTRIPFSSGLFSGFLFPVTGTNVQEAMDIYGATRIGHGYRSVETQVLIPPGKRWEKRGKI